MPLTTVFEIGPGTFTVVLYPTPTTSSTSQATTTTTSHLTTRTATRSIDKNVHQLNTSLPFSSTFPFDSSSGTLSTSSFSTDGILIGQTTVISGSTYTLGLEPYTYTSNGGVYTSVRVERGAVQTGSEAGVEERNKSILTPIITATVLTIVLGFLASLGGCWLWRRRRRRLRSASATINPPGTPEREKGRDGNVIGTGGEKEQRDRGRGRLSRLDIPGFAGTRSAMGTISTGRSGLLSAASTPTSGPVTGSTSTSTSTLTLNGRVPLALTTRRLSVDTMDEPRIETMSIEEGTVTPFTLPALMAAAVVQGGHRSNNGHGHVSNNNNGNTNMTHDGRGDPRYRRESFSTLSTTDESDVFAMDGDSIARTLTGSSLASREGLPPAYEPVEGGTYGSWATTTRDPFADPHQLQLQVQTQFRSHDRHTLQRRDTGSSETGSILSAAPSSLLQPPSEAGQSERSNPQTEASYRRGDDQDIHLGDRWTRTDNGARTGSRSGSFQGWSDSEEADSDSDDEGTIVAGSDRILGDDESWVNGSEFGRRTKARQQQEVQGGGDDEGDVFGDAHRAT